jgi:hypothetical protein
MRAILVFALISLSLQAFAVPTISGKPVDESKEAEIAQKVKKRLYPGGRDEGDLKVQAQLITPARKLSPQAEIKEEAAAEE